MLRKVLVLTAALFAVLATAAQAHTASASVSCGSVTVNWLDFASSGSGNGGLNSPTYSISYTPHGETTPSVTFSGQVNFPGSFYSMTFAIPPFDGTVAASSQWTTAQTRDRTADSASGVFTVGDCPKSSPAISTTATPASATVNSPLTDVASLTGGDRPSGTITWRLYGPDDPTCSNPNPPSVTASVTGDGQYTSLPVTATTVGTYQWVASYGGDQFNNPVSGHCGDANETVTVGPATPTLTTQASPAAAALGTAINDVATLSGGDNPTGTLQWALYGPGDASCSSSTPLETASVPVSGDHQYTSPPLTPTVGGAYQWVATYSGDVNNAKVGPVGCTDPNEAVTIGALTTTATPPTVTVGQPVHDVAHLSGNNPTGTITFDLYGPNPGTCTGTPVQSVKATVNGAGDYPSPSVVMTGTGTYVWVASYSGDANNLPLQSGCADATETVTVTPATPALTTQATPATAKLGTAIADVATLSGGYDPTGTLQWALYGPNDASCSSSTPLQTETVAVTGDGSYTSPSLTPTAAGGYQWVATYSGDANNVKVGPVGCTDPNEAVTIGALTTTATPPTVTVGQPVHDVAHLSGNNPTGTITFDLYGPNPGTCTGTPVQSVKATVNGAGDYPSPSVVMTGTGTYVWVASYSGDANNPALQSGCADATETVTVTPATPALTTSASPASVTLGASVADVATLSGGYDPTGTLQWALYGPNDASCSSSTPLQTQTVAVTGDGSYTSPSLTPTAAGSYHWVATYSGDANNVKVGPVGCTDPNEGLTVNSPPSPPLTPSFTLTKLQAINGSGAAFTTAPIVADIGQQIDYQVVVTNTGNEPLNLALVDTMCTSIAGPTGAVSGTTLVVGGTATWTCSHVVVAADYPTYVNVAQVTATPPGGSPLPPQRSSVLANVPKGGVSPVCVASALKIKQTTTNKGQTVNAIVTGGGLKKVVFSLDGRAVQTLTKPNISGGRYQLSIKLAGTRYGTHSVTAKATNSCGKASSDGLTFSHNAPVKKIVPRFTG